MPWSPPSPRCRCHARCPSTRPQAVSVSYAGTTLPARGTCNGPGWRFDPATSSIVACPETCAALAADDGSGVVVASVGCFSED